jgi:ribosomal-protein-alanine N-acetyltransferase
MTDGKTGNPKQILETPRLIVREFCAEDVDALARVISDPETMSFYAAPFDRSGVEEWIERNRRRYSKDGHGLWAVIFKTSGELIGDCGLVVQDVEGVNEIEVAYHVRRDLWGRDWLQKQPGHAVILDSLIFELSGLFR